MCFDSNDNILIAGFTEMGRDNDETVVKVLAICRKVNLKLNKDKCLRCISIPFFEEVISQNGVSPDPKKVQVLMDIPPYKYKKDLVSFLGMINFLSKISPAAAEVSKPLRKHTLVKAEWSWNGMYQYMYEKAKKLIT